MCAKPGKPNRQGQSLVGCLAEQLREPGIEARKRHQERAAVIDDAAECAPMECERERRKGDQDSGADEDDRERHGRLNP